MSRRVEIKEADNGFIVTTYDPGTSWLKDPFSGYQTLVFESLKEAAEVVEDFLAFRPSNPEESRNA